MLRLSLSAPIHYRGKDSQPAKIRSTHHGVSSAPRKSTIIRCNSDRHAFQCSQTYSQKIISVLIQWVPFVLEYASCFTNSLYEYMLFIFMHFFQLCANIAQWYLCCKISFIHSPCWKVSYLSLQVVRNMHLWHNFVALNKKFFSKHRKSEELHHSLNVICLLLKIIQRHINERHTRKHPLRFQVPKPSNQWWKAEHFTLTCLNSGSESQTPKKPSKKRDIGSHRVPTFPFGTLEPYLINNLPISQLSHMHFSFVDHVDDIGSLEYPKDQYTHASVSLQILFSTLQLKSAKKIASKHGISAGSRCTMADLKAHVAGHTCLVCNTHHSIFMLQHNRVHESMQWSKIHREKTKASECQKANSQKANIDFPPTPVDPQLSHKIITSACKKMSTPCIEQSGCAILQRVETSQCNEQVEKCKEVAPHSCYSWCYVKGKERCYFTNPRIFWSSSWLQVQ